MSAKIRILHMIGSLRIGGSQSFVMNIYRKIDRNRIQFDFIVDSSKNNYYLDEIKKMGGKVYYFPKFNGKNYFKIKKFWTFFLEKHKEYQVLHSHVRSYASIYIPIATSFGLFTIIHSHSNSNGKGIVALGKNILQFPLRFQADYYMACSKKAGEWLFGKKICHTEKFCVIKNAIDVDNFVFNERNRERTRFEFGLKDEFVLGYLARVTVAKNPLFVIDVMYELIKMIPNAKLLFIGDGELLTTVMEKIEELGIQKNAIITGARTDVSHLLAAMDCYILPSFWEGLGISLIEAQAAGIHCICSEGIQDEAIVSDLVDRYPLSIGAKAWAENIASVQQIQTRPNLADKIKMSGYDVCENANMLQEFYKKICVKN